MKKVIIVSLALIFLGGIYVARSTLETMWALALTAGDVFFLSGDSAKNATADASASGKQEKPGVDFAAKYSNSLMVMENDSPHSYDAAKLAGIKYWAFYYATSTNPACRVFTPDLVSFYRTFKAFHPDFEIIYVDLDGSEGDMLSFMRANAMMWPTVWYADIDNSELEAKKYLRGPLPCLVLVDSQGHVLSETTEGVDPRKLIDDIRAMVD